jgi:LPXTG-motif cell wall-anchored protein
MRKLALMAFFCSCVLYAPMPLIAQNGGGETPLIPVADMPNSSGGATAPSEPPLEVDPEAVPQLAPPSEVGGGAEAPTSAPAPAPAPAPGPEPTVPQAHAAVPDPEPAVTPPPAALPAEPAQDDPVGDDEPTPDDEPTDEPTDQAPESDEPDEEEFEEEFEGGPAPGEPQEPGVTPGVEPAGPQLPQTGSDLPALLLSGLALAAAGLSLRALVGPPAPRPPRPARKLPSRHAHARALRPSLGPDYRGGACRPVPPPLG